MGVPLDFANGLASRARASLGDSFGRVNHAACTFLGPQRCGPTRPWAPEPDARRPDRIPRSAGLAPLGLIAPGVYRVFSTTTIFFD
jgi:hypothetical protein